MLKTSVKEIEEATSKWKNTLCLWIARITTALSHSMKPSHASGATQDGQVMVERSDRMWPCGHVYSLLAGMAAIMQPLSWLTQQPKQQPYAMLSHSLVSHSL